MILKVIREEENKGTKSKNIKTEYYSGKNVSLEENEEVNDPSNLSKIVKVDNEVIMLDKFFALDSEDNEINSKVLNAYLMSDEGKTIERII